MNRLRRRRKLQPWPRPQESIERQIDTRSKTMSRSLAWVPKGPALDTYETKIRGDLEAILANIELPEGAPLFLKLYMVGRDEGSANPMVMVCCVHRVKRKEAELSIRESRILDSFPGFGLGSSALLLESHGLEELLTREYQPGDPGSQSSVDPSEAGSTLEIYGEFPHKPGGTIRFVATSHDEEAVVHKATGGPIFQLDTELYQITAGHGMDFKTPDTKIHYSSSELDECEFDGQSNSGDDLTTSKGSLTPEQAYPASSEEDSCSSRLSGEETTRPETPKADQQTPVAHALHTRTQPDEILPRMMDGPGSLPRRLERLTIQLHNPELDYVLLKLPAQPSLCGSIPNLTPLGHGSKAVTKTSHVRLNNTRILVVSPDGPILGTISTETTSYKMRGFTKLQQLLTVQLDRAFHKGDSGSAVVDFATRALYGQILIGNPGQPLAYCVRAPSIFADILDRTGHIPILNERHWQINTQQEIRDADVPLKTETTSTDVPKNEKPPSNEALQSVSRTFAPLEPLGKGHRPEPSRSKRKRGSESPQPSKESSRIETAPSLRMQVQWACPFYVHDRFRHYDCAREKYTDIDRLLEHLVSGRHKHIVHCPMCGIVFIGPTSQAKKQLDEHYQEASCERPQYPLGYKDITEAQEREIRSITSNGRMMNTPAPQLWHMIWHALFPGELPPFRPDSIVPMYESAIHPLSESRDTIAGAQNWREVPYEPWGSAERRREEQISRMSNFIQTFMAQARNIMNQNASSTYGDQPGKYPKYTEDDTPGLSSVTEKRVAPSASWDSIRPADAPIKTNLDPSSESRRGSPPRKVIKIESSPGELPLDAAQLPLFLNNATGDVPQDIQQVISPETAETMHTQTSQFSGAPLHEIPH